MRFLFVVPHFHYNLYHAVKALQNRGHFVEMAVKKKSSGFGLLTPIDIEEDVNYKNVLHILNNARPDVIVLRDFGKGWNRFYLASNLIAAKPLVLEYSLRPFRRPDRTRVMLKRLARLRPRIRISPSANLDQKARPKDSFFVPFPIETGGVSPIDRTRDEGPVRILCVGKLMQKRKQQDLLLDALEPLADKHDFIVTLAGSTTISASGATQGHFEQLRRRAEFGPLASRIHILEDVPFADMAAVYKDHDLFVLPAFNEPLGISVPEAMAYGCAVMLTDTCGAVGYVTPDCGVTFRERDVNDLRAALERLLADPALVRRMGRAAAETISRNHTPDGYVTRMENLARYGDTRQP